MNNDILVKVIKEVLDVYKVGKEQLADGFQTKDIIPILWEAKDLNIVISQAPAIKSRWNEIKADPKQIEALVLALMEELGITRPEVLNLAQAVMNFLEAGYQVYIAVKALKTE